VANRVHAGVADEGGYLPQPEAEPPVGQHLPQPLHVGRRVGPVPARRPRRRLDQADLVIVMQRADRDAGQLGHPPDGQRLRRALVHVR
jgi:hypothetical protein